MFRRRLAPHASPWIKLDSPSVSRWSFAAVLLLGLAVSCSERPLPEGDAHTSDLAAGQRIFERKCASCHNTNGDGKTVTAGRFPYANLVDGIWRSDGSALAIEKQIREGHDPMPKFEGKLTDEEIRHTVTYVLELSRKGQERSKRETPPGSNP
jgi:mono/diheme cytochrome c family protein